MKNNHQTTKTIKKNFSSRNEDDRKTDSGTINFFKGKDNSKIRNTFNKNKNNNNDNNNNDNINKSKVVDEMDNMLIRSSLLDTLNNSYIMLNDMSKTIDCKKNNDVYINFVTTQYKISNSLKSIRDGDEITSESINKIKLLIDDVINLEHSYNYTKSIK